MFGANCKCERERERKRKMAKMNLQVTWPRKMKGIKMVKMDKEEDKEMRARKK